MKTPDVIYLIDMGDEIAWCDDPNPSGEYEPDDSIAYVKKAQRDQLLETLEEARMYVDMAGENCYNPVADKLLEKIDAAIAAAKGEV